MHILQEIIKYNKALEAPKQATYETPHTQYIIEIDKNHIATLTIDNDSLEVLNNLKDKPIESLSEEEAKEFFKSNFLNQDFEFCIAIEALKKGFKVSRRGWNSECLFIALHTPDKNSKMKRSYIYISILNDCSDCNKAVWLPDSQDDIFSEDWFLVE